jgi:hypothetical protein
VWEVPGGKRKFEPTDEQRRLVEGLSGLGIRQINICSMVLGWDGKPISVPTLEKYFRREIDTGATKLKSRIGNFMIATILGHEIEQPKGPKPEHRIKPITDEKSRINDHAAQFVGAIKP